MSLIPRLSKHRANTRR